MLFCSILISFILSSSLLFSSPTYLRGSQRSVIQSKLTLANSPAPLPPAVPPDDWKLRLYTLFRWPTSLWLIVAVCQSQRMMLRSSDAVATIFVRKEERSRGETERRRDGETEKDEKGEF